MTTIVKQGILPPGNWAIGARVCGENPEDTGVLVSRFGQDIVDVRYDDGDLGETEECVTCIHLDLTYGCLSHGLRALQYLIAPDSEQTESPPRWFRINDNWGPCWVLSTKYNDHLCQYHFRSNQGDWIDNIIPGISEEEDPRRALTLALNLL